MATTEQALAAAAQSLALPLDGQQVEQLNHYLNLLHKWNAAYNLSAFKNIDEMLVKHLFDCMAVVSPIYAHFAPNLSTGSPEILDVGSGAGLPGVVLAICLPQLSVTMLDAVQKKMIFVRQAIAELKLSNAQAHGSRIQDWTKTYPLITARAWTALGEIPRLAGHCLAENGVIAAMKGPRLSQEAQALPTGWVLNTTLDIHVPELKDARTLAMIRRQS